MDEARTAFREASRQELGVGEAKEQPAMNTTHPSLNRGGSFGGNSSEAVVKRAPLVEPYVCLQSSIPIVAINPLIPTFGKAVLRVRLFTA